MLVVPGRHRSSDKHSKDGVRWPNELREGQAVTAMPSSLLDPLWPAVQGWDHTRNRAGPAHVHRRSRQV